MWVFIFYLALFYGTTSASLTNKFGLGCASFSSYSFPRLYSAKGLCLRMSCCPPQQLLMSFWFTSLFCTFFSLLRCVFTSCTFLFTSLHVSELSSRILCFGALLSKIGLKRNILALRLHTDLSKRQKKQCPKNKIPCCFVFFWHVWTLFHTFEPSVFSLNPHWCKRHWSGLYNKVMIYNMSI